MSEIQPSLERANNICGAYGGDCYDVAWIAGKADVCNFYASLARVLPGLKISPVERECTREMQGEYIRAASGADARMEDDSLAECPAVILWRASQVGRKEQGSP